MVMILESKERSDEEVRAFKLALVTHDPTMATRLYSNGEPEEKVNVEAEDISLGDTEGKWEFAYDPEEAKRVLADMLGDTSGSLTLPDAGLKPLDDDGWN